MMSQMTRQYCANPSLMIFKALTYFYDVSHDPPILRNFSLMILEAMSRFHDVSNDPPILRQPFVNDFQNSNLFLICFT